MTNFPEGTRVRLLENHPHENATGTIEHAKSNGMNALIKLDIGGTTFAQDSQMEALPTVGIGDLVRINTIAGRWAAQEGHVIKVGPNVGVTVDLGYDETPTFHESDLEIIEKLPVKPVRIEGQPIKPTAIKRGDKISVVSTEENEIKRTIILEAVVDKIVLKSFGSVIQFQTRSGAHIHTSDSQSKAVISLVKDIDKDIEYQSLAKAMLGDIIAFADEAGGVETNIAVKQGDDFWSLILGSKKAKTVETVGLVNILNKYNVTYSPVRTGAKEAPLPFPVGTNVKVSSGFSSSMSKRDYRVVIAGPEHSTVKSRGVSAATHLVPNRWLIKD